MTQERVAGDTYTSCEVRLKLRETDPAFPDLVRRVETAYGEPMDDNRFIPSIPSIPSKDPETSVIRALRGKKILFSYVRMFSGKRAKTETIYAYLAADEDGQVYYYQFD